jgi:hypothetical protein
MTEVILFLLGTLVATGLFLHVSRRSSNNSESCFLSDGDEMGWVDESMSTLPPAMLAGRIFSVGDLESLSSATPSLRKAFLQERTRLASDWLHRTRSQTRKAYDSFLAKSRVDSRVNPLTELRIASSYFYFLFTWQMANELIFLFGPFRARRTFECLLNASDSLRLVLGGDLAVKHYSMIRRGK